MHVSNEFRDAFLQWVADTVSGRASIYDKVAVVGDEQVSIPKLLGRLSRCSDQLPSHDTWIVTDYPEIVGRGAWRTYKNAVRVVRAWRRQ